MLEQGQKTVRALGLHNLFTLDKVVEQTLKFILSILQVAVPVVLNRVVAAANQGGTEARPLVVICQLEQE